MSILLLQQKKNPMAIRTYGKRTIRFTGDDARKLFNDATGRTGTVDEVKPIRPRKETAATFTNLMVSAILEDIKNVTRRKFRSQPEGGPMPREEWGAEQRHLGRSAASADMFPFYLKGRGAVSYSCPYGRVGDWMYVREEYYQYGHWEMAVGEKTKGGKQKWKFVPDNEDIIFYEPVGVRKGRHHNDPYTPAWHKRLARFMPKRYARIWLEVTNVDAERVQDITEEQAKAEGIRECVWQDIHGVYRIADTRSEAFLGEIGDYRTAFECLWKQINGKDSWNNNDWVFAVSFKVLSKTGKPE